MNGFIGTLVVTMLLMIAATAFQINRRTFINAPKRMKTTMMAETGTKTRKPWEFGRFLKTATFYGGLTPRIPFINTGVTKDRVLVEKDTVLWSQSDPLKYNIQWGPLDDVVMGGASKSDLIPGERFTGLWTGTTTTANNGGFAGIRTKLFNKPFDASSCTGLKLKLKGDGNRYKCIIRDDSDWNGVAWSASVDTNKDKVVEVKLPFDKFRPTLFARVLYKPNKFDRQQLMAMQLTLSKFEYDGALNPKFAEGPFKLEVQSIGTY